MATALAWNLREALSFLHHPTPDVSLATLEDHSHPAWQRLKAEELLAQQLSQLQSKRERDRCVRPLRRRRRNGGRCMSSAGRAALQPDRRPAARGRRNCRRPGPRRAHAPPAAGRRGLGQDRGGGAGRAICIDAGLAVRADGAHRNPGRAALSQADRLAGAAAGITRPRVAWLTGSQKKRSARAMLALVASGEAPWWWARTP
jgi:ATP-dependent DNA helicase RecG